MKSSIVVATYNGANYIIEQLESIKNQTKKVDEVIICDDKSNDGTYEIIELYIRNNNLSNWTVYLNDDNLGYANNFFYATLKATNDIIFFCDQDDIWEADRIQIMIELFENNKSINLLWSEVVPFCTGDNIDKLSPDVLNKMTYDNNLEKKILSYKNIFIGAEGCTMAFRKDFLDKIKEYWFSGWAHDEFLWKMAVCDNSCYMLHKSTLKRRIHGQNVSIKKMHRKDVRISFLEKLYESHIQIMKYSRDTHKDKYTLKIIQENIDSVKLRLDLLSKKHIWNIIPLTIKYWNCFHSRKSILMECIIALKG